MSHCTILKPRVSLAGKAQRGPGLGMEESAAAAAAEVAALQGEVEARVGAIVARLEVLRGCTAAREEMRALADELAGLCGPFGLVVLGGAASSLCRLLDFALPPGVADVGIAVHLDALVLLSNPAASAGDGEAEALLAGLRKVVAALHAAPDVAGNA